MDVSTVRLWVVHFSSGDSDMKDKPCSGQPCTAVTPEMKSVLINSSRQSVDYDLELCTELNIGFNAVGNGGGNVAKLVPGRSHKCSHRNRKNTKFVRIY